MEEILTPEELLLLSITAISGIHLDEADHEPKKITDRRLTNVLYGISRRYQIYSYEIPERGPLDFPKTLTIMRLCDFYFSVEFFWSTKAIKIRWMEDLDFKTMRENEKETFDRMDMEE